jgi:polyhydroxybutyrate depolymerase
VFACALAAACSDTRTDPPATASPQAADGLAGTHHREVEVGGRSYDVYAPASYDSSVLTPAVIAFHGRSGSPTDILRASGLDVLADEEGFLAVLPRGESRRWEPEAGGTDIQFVEALIQDLVGSWNADPTQIYVTGFSNGADMAIVSALALPDLVAAAAPVTPSGTGSVAEVIEDLAAPVPVVAFIGEQDDFAEVGLDMLASWRAGAGCGDEQSESTDQVATTHWNCGGSPFTVHVVAGQGHVWFGYPSHRDPIWASETMWEFFQEQA